MASTAHSVTRLSLGHKSVSFSPLSPLKLTTFNKLFTMNLLPHPLSVIILLSLIAVVGTNNIEQKWLAINGKRTREDVWLATEHNESAKKCLLQFPSRPIAIKNIWIATCQHVADLRNCLSQVKISKWLLDDLVTTFTHDQVKEGCFSPMTGTSDLISPLKSMFDDLPSCSIFTHIVNLLSGLIIIFCFVTKVCYYIILCRRRWKLHGVKRMQLERRQNESKPSSVVVVPSSPEADQIQPVQNNAIIEPCYPTVLVHQPQ